MARPKMPLAQAESRALAGSSVPLRALTLALVLAVLAGCHTTPPRADLAATAPATAGDARQRPAVPRLGGRLRSATLTALRDRGTWLPLAGAAVLSIGSLDEDLADWGAREQPLFGGKAADRSDLLLDLSRYSALATALLMPAERWSDRGQNLLFAAGTLLANGAVVEAGKSLSQRTRPNGRGNRSFPSGHASQAATGSVLTVQQLQAAGLSPPWQRVAHTGFTLSAATTGWARIEARKHFPTDVLVGYALGNFMANFARALFYPESPATLGLAPMADGMALTLTLPVH
ncbi:MAG: phosphatase PAP2 family protein [Pseudomonadota bacterium]